MMDPNRILKPRQTIGASVGEISPQYWRLSLSAGQAQQYRCAQLDDYMDLPRSKFFWQSSIELELEARTSSLDIPGTWGFGFWNDPFAISFGQGGKSPRLPELPNSAWFFYASPDNHLALQDCHPAQGFLASTFRSPRIPSLLLALGVPFLPFLLWPKTASGLRRLGSKFVQEDAYLVNMDTTQWHHYELTVGTETTRFSVDKDKIFETHICPKGRLGLVMWIDNQYAAFPPHGKIGYGTLPNAGAAWLEIKNLYIQSRLDDECY